MKKSFIVFLMLFLVPFFASAKIEPITKPSEIESFITSEAPYASSDFTWYLINIYHIDLWSDTKNFSLDKNISEIFALSIKYKIKITRDDLVQSTIDEMSRISGKPSSSFEKYRQKLQKVFPNVGKNDKISAINIPSKGVKFFYNSSETGEILDKEFSKEFFAIWLSPQTQNQKLYKKLVAE